MMGAVGPAPESRKKMTVTLNLSPETQRRLQALAAQAGQSVEEYLQQLVEARASGENGVPSLAGAEAYLDHEFVRGCAAEADESVTLEDVRRALAKIPGSMTGDFIAERDEP
jgi:hypothetical protein